MENYFDEVLRRSYTHNYTDIKNEIIRRNITLKKNNKWKNKRGVPKVKKKKKKRVVRPQRGNSKISDFVQLAYQSSKFGNVTDNRKLNKKKRTGLQKEKIELD